MNNQIFNSLTESEINIGFEIILMNANIHFDSAKILAKQKYFGLAISHLILASEEAIKAIFFLRKKLFPDQEVDISGIFSSHKMKHETAIEIADLVKNFQVDLRKTMIEDLKNRPDVDMKVKLLIEKENELVNNKFNELTAEKILNWWNQADNLKQKGFYVDYINNCWTSPVDIDLNEYENSYTITGQYLGFINLINDYF